MHAKVNLVTGMDRVVISFRYGEMSIVEPRNVDMVYRVQPGRRSLNLKITSPLQVHLIETMLPAV